MLLLPLYASGRLLRFHDGLFLPGRFWSFRQSVDCSLCLFPQLHALLYHWHRVSLFQRPHVQLLILPHAWLFLLPHDGLALPLHAAPALPLQGARPLADHVLQRCVSCGLRFVPIYFFHRYQEHLTCYAFCAAASVCQALNRVHGSGALTRFVFLAQSLSHQPPLGSLHQQIAVPGGPQGFESQQPAILQLHQSCCSFLLQFITLRRRTSKYYVRP
ncbi:hypothetical protein D3C72_419130 [compost metagenome]